MTKDTYYAGAYWAGSKEGLRKCTARTTTFLKLLRECDPLWHRWFIISHGRNNISEVELTEDTIAELLVEGRNRTDYGDKVVDELGFSLSLWTNRPEGENSNLSIRCGVFSKYVPNRCVLDLPSKGTAHDRVLSLKVMKCAMQAMASAWEPDWGVVASRKYRNRILSSIPDGPFVGWMTFLSAEVGELPILPLGVQVERIKDSGRLIILSKNPIAADDSTSVELAREVLEILQENGKLSFAQAME